MSIIRTPDERFTNLPDFPYEPHYVELNRIRVHYIEKGEGDVILCLHGEPSWSYLYRKMIPKLSVNHRVMAMDFIGFGRSDKYTKEEEYSFRMHCDTLIAFIRKMDLNNITLIVQDWGGLIGLSVVGELQERFARLVIMNTGLPTGEEKIPFSFHIWRFFAKITPVFPIGRMIYFDSARHNKTSKEIIAAYDAPFPDSSYKAGARAWPLLVPLRPGDPGTVETKRGRDVLSRWNKPALVMFSDGDPVTRGQEIIFRDLIPTAKDQPEIVIKNAGHFLQESHGEELAENIVNFIDRTPIKSSKKQKSRSKK